MSPIISGGVGGLPGVTLSGTPVAGQMIFALSPSTADWESLAITQVQNGPHDSAWVPTGTHAGNDEFNTGALDPAWTLINTTGNSSVTVGADVASALCTSSGATAGDGLVRAITIAQGGYIETAVRIAGNPASAQMMAGLVFADAAATTANISAFVVNKTDGKVSPVSSRFNNYAIGVGAAAGIGSWTGGLIYMRMTWVAANTWRIALSPDGVTWNSTYLADQAVTLTPTHMGLTWSPIGANRITCSFEYFRCSG